MKIKNILPVIVLIFILTSCSGDGGGGSSSNTADTSGGDNPARTTGPSKLNDTGITWGGDYPSGDNTGCTGVKIAQQDCSHGRDALAAKNKLIKTGGGLAGFDFTKLGKDGKVLADQKSTWSDTGSEAAGTRWSCVKDNHTGLVWEVKTNDGSAPTGSDPVVSKNNIHHKDNRYRWGGLTALGREKADNKGTYYDDWNSLVTDTNSEQLCGFGEWRVPEIEELGSIVHAGITNPAIDTRYFPNTSSEYYWSSSPDAFDSDSAWRLYFKNGRDGINYRDNGFRVRLVRFEQ